MERYLNDESQIAKDKVSIVIEDGSEPYPQIHEEPKIKEEITNEERAKRILERILNSDLDDMRKFLKDITLPRETVRTNSEWSAYCIAILMIQFLEKRGLKERILDIGDLAAQTVKEMNKMEVKK